MNKKIIIVVVIIVLVCAISFILSRYVFYDKYKMPKGAEIEIKNEKFQIYSQEKNLYDLISKNNVEILTENVNLDNKNVGKHKITIEYKYKDIRQFLYDIEYEVVDTIAPIFIKDPISTVSFYVNEATEEDLEKLKNKISYADNYDINPVLKFEGDVNFQEIGTYTIKYTLLDSSKNETTRSTDIVIKERPIKTQTDTEKLKEENKEEKDNSIHFEDHIKKYKNDNTMVGIDVSKWQGEIDFEKVKEAGCEFVIMRVGVMKDKDSELMKDNTFDANYEKAKKAGLKVGLYFYSESNNVETAISNAKFIIDQLNGDKLDFPVTFDWESWEYFNSMEMNLHMLNEMYDAFSNTLKEAGYDSMLYCSEYYLNNVWMDLKDYTIWVAKYSSKEPNITSGNRYILWQNACTGKIDGINADVDLDIYYKQ